MDNINYYLAHLWRKGLKISSLRTNLAAISFYHKINGFNDPCSSFCTKQILKGSEKLTNRNYNYLLPISKELLHRLILVLPKVTLNNYDTIMYKSLFLLTYYCCLRAGEAVHSNTTDHTLCLHQVSASSNSNGNILSINFESYKHSKNLTPRFLLHNISSSYCPVDATIAFLHIRGDTPGPLFINKRLVPLHRKNFSNILKKCFSALNLDNTRYNTHSLRIGRATDLDILGVEHEIIKQTGRWNSNAYLKYLRNSSFRIPTL